jgi:hypothetical protein
MQKNYVISANYRDRDDVEFPFLVRRIEDPIDSATKCRTVEAENIQVQDSGHEEIGFGCNVVVVAESVTTDPPLTSPGIPVRFTGTLFVPLDATAPEGGWETKAISAAKRATFRKGETVFFV